MDETEQRLFGCAGRRFPNRAKALPGALAEGLEAALRSLLTDVSFLRVASADFHDIEETFIYCGFDSLLLGADVLGVQGPAILRKGRGPRPILEPLAAGEDKPETLARLLAFGGAENLGSIPWPKGGEGGAAQAGLVKPKAVHIALVGPMGSGKTSVGRLLARLLCRDFADSDEVVEAETGASIPKIFEAEGEAGFRLRESRALARLLSGEAKVIATGGGVVLSRENRAALAATSLVVWLHAPPSVLASRASNGNRPLLAGGDAERKLETIYRSRLSLYAQSSRLLLPIGTMDARRIAEVLYDEIQFSL